MIDTAVTNVEDLSSLEDYLTGLGRKHRAVGVKLSSFSVGKGALALSACGHHSLPVLPSLPPFLYPQTARAGAWGWYSPAWCFLDLSEPPFFPFSGRASFRTRESGERRAILGLLPPRMLPCRGWKQAWGQRLH